METLLFRYIYKERLVKTLENIAFLQRNLHEIFDTIFFYIHCRYRWNTVISELNKNDNFHSRYNSRHFVVDVIWRLPVWNVKIRRYLASCTLQFGSNLTKIIFQGKHFNYFIVVGGWRHVFWSDTHSISLRYTHNIVQLNWFYIKFYSKHFF